MSDNSSIEWTNTTWNPTTGCDRVSPGCDHCYALTLAKRLKGMGSPKYQNDGDPTTSGPGFGATEHPDSLTAPLSWRKPRKVFVNSMSDLFHKAFSDEYIARVFAVMAATPQHTYQILTKRHARMRSLLSDRWWSETLLPELVDEYERGDYAVSYPLPNVWLGVSVENQQWADIRIPALLDTPAAVRFLSCEPLLGPVDLKAHWLRPTFPGPRVDWAIAGGESGAEHRPLDLDWVRGIRDACARNCTAFLFKQVGGRTPKAGGRELDGRTWDEYPEVAGV